MPAPLPPLITALALKALDARGIQGSGAQPLSIALGLAIGGSLLAFLPMCMVRMGQAAVLDPLTLSGATAMPGDLMGGLPAPMAIGLTTVALAAQGLLGESTPKMGMAVGTSIAQALDKFVEQVKAAPGAAIVTGVTVAPAMLMGPAPDAESLEPLCKSALEDNDIKGEGGLKLAGVLAEVLDGTFKVMLASVMVAPGVAAAPGATTSPGMLI